MAVNEMWKLCKVGSKSRGELSYTSGSEDFGTDF
jgi:hypothetical protein